jgi:serine/threonine protein kinase
VIGEGAFAQVWKAAHHERPARVVAVKIATDPAFRKQLSREGRLPDIKHRNVVPILDSDTRFAEHPYVVMPFYSAGSLADLIARHPHGLPEDRVHALLKGILSGLSAAHRQGIVHRDIKPANILLDEDGKALVSDFGLSLHESAPDGAKSLVQSTSRSMEPNGALAGTLAYMAPEVLGGAAGTKASDVYSVGLLLFEMLTGRRPAGLELPSQVRTDLRRSAHFDGLFYCACRPVAERYSDGSAMRAAAVTGPAGMGLALPGAARATDTRVRISAGEESSSVQQSAPSALPTAKVEPPPRPTISLCDAASDGNLDQIRRHIYWGCNLNGGDDLDDIPIYCAIDQGYSDGHLRVVEALLEGGADPNIRYPDDELWHDRTPLEQAWRLGRKQIVRLLMARGARKTDRTVRSRS